MKAGDLIQWFPAWTAPNIPESEIGLVVKAAEGLPEGWWILWANGKVQILPIHLRDDARILNESR